MIFCARAMRGLRRMGRERPGCHSRREKRASLEGSFISFDARSKGQPRLLLLEDVWSRNRDGRVSLEGPFRPLEKTPGTFSFSHVAQLLAFQQTQR
jgi:hypothetical protein